MKGYLYSFILALFVLTGAWGPDAACAQGHEKSASHVVQGKVVDADGLPLVGVNVIVKNQPGLGTNTDIDGNYRIRTGANETLVFSYLGYATQEIPIVSKSTMTYKWRRTPTPWKRWWWSEPATRSGPRSSGLSPR